MSEPIKIVDYTKAEVTCPECVGKGFIFISEYGEKATQKQAQKMSDKKFYGEYFGVLNCEGCGGNDKKKGSGKLPIIKAIIKRLEETGEVLVLSSKCPRDNGLNACTALTDGEKDNCNPNCEDIVNIKKEQVLKKGDKLDFALSTGRCDDCIEMRHCFYFHSRGDCENCTGIEPRIIKAEVLEDAIEVIKNDKGLGTPFYEDVIHDNLRRVLLTMKDNFKVLPNGEYLLVDLRLIE